jgi:hypothetical protein
MDNEEILNLYKWETGTCFQCARPGLDTTLVEVLHPTSSPPQQIRACRDCLLVLEAERRLAAARKGEPYEPGQVRPTQDDSDA